MRLFLGAIMKLIGSNPSPFARRVRMWAAQNNVDLALVNLDIFSEQDRPTLASNNPGRKIPVLIDGDLTLSDSTIILRYLIAKAGKTPLSWSQEHLLNIINACNDSLVELALSRRSGFDTSDDKLFFNLQNERIAETLSYLNSHLTDEQFISCDCLAISLYCLLDWIYFRDLHDLTPFTQLVAFHHRYSFQASAKQTDPRN